MRIPERHLWLELQTGSVYIIDTNQVHFFISPAVLEIYEALSISESLEIRARDIKNLNYVRKFFSLPDHLLVPPQPTPDETKELAETTPPPAQEQPTNPDNIIE